MKLHRMVIVFDARDVGAESAFWARILDARVLADDDGGWHSVVNAENQWIIGVQSAPDHVAPSWPSGDHSQQVHLDLHVEDFASAHVQVIEAGARLLQAAQHPEAEEGFAVYASPAGHPFCLGWGQPSEERLRAYLTRSLN